MSIDVEKTGVGRVVVIYLMVSIYINFQEISIYFQGVYEWG